MPRFRTTLVPRLQRLARPVVDDLPSPTVLSAPAGFGETTLISGWCEAIAHQQKATAAPICCWLALDNEDRATCSDSARRGTALVSLTSRSIVAQTRCVILCVGCPLCVWTPYAYPR
ncbi:MAG: hypothetical protein R2867_44985 [Caldilineaceae bacterium]